MRRESPLRTDLSALIAVDPTRLRLLGLVAALDLPDGWIGAGFVRSAVWDHLHGRAPACTWDDIDVVWFDREKAMPSVDAEIEARLRQMDPSANWSVKNQARMHTRNGDAPYRTTEEAVSRWPDTATAIAVRLNGGSIDIMAPHGLDDLFSMVVRPTPAFSSKLPVFRSRVSEKHWLERWPRLTVALPSVRVLPPGLPGVRRCRLPK